MHVICVALQQILVCNRKVKMELDTLGYAYCFLDATFSFFLFSLILMVGLNQNNDKCRLVVK